jgi:predicted phosphodiesterase
MRVAALYDIHGNLPALEAVLEDVQRSGADHIVVGGDVMPGPMPGESLECLLGCDIPVQFIRGNGDRVVLAQMGGIEPTEVPEPFREAIRWGARELYTEYEQMLGSWPTTLRMQIPGLGELLFCHATPRNDTDIFTRLTPEARLLPIFEGLSAAVVVCGHTHMQFDRMIGSVRVVNAGSVGMPFGEPGAYWLLLGPEVALQRTDYDFAKAGERIRGTQYPRAEGFVERSVFKPPSEREMLEAFSKVEIK